MSIHLVDERPGFRPEAWEPWQYAACVCDQETICKYHAENTAAAWNRFYDPVEEFFIVNRAAWAIEYDPAVRLKRKRPRA